MLSDDDVVYLSGDLGAGKTVLVKGIVEGLGLARSRDVLSPSFTLLRSYRGARELHHVDLYRVRRPSDAAQIVDMAPPGILVIEWPERGEGFLPAPTWSIHLNIVEGDVRALTVAGPGHLVARLRG